MSTESALQFATFVKQKYPKLFEAARERADRATNVEKVTGMGLVDPSSIGKAAKSNGGWWNTFLKSTAALGTTYLTLKNQRDALKMNLKRQEQGLAPVDIQPSGPVIRTQVDLPPDVVQKVTSSAGLQVNKILMFGAFALAAVLLLGPKRRGR